MTTSSPATPLALDPGTVHREVLPNGLTVLVRQDRSAPVVAIVTYVKAGYFDETDDVVGIAHVLEHMFFKGTERRGVGEIAKETKASGGYLNAHTIYDHTAYYTVLPSSGFAAGLDIQADAYANSVIDAAELAKELEVIIQEAKRKDDNPSAVATESLYALLHDEHRIRRWRIGREAPLRALTREQLVRFYRNFYRPRNTILSIVGDVAVDDVMAQVRARYGAIADAPIARSPGPSEPPHRGFRYKEWDGDIAQSEVAIGWRTAPAMHPDAPLLDLASTVLGSGRASRLYRAVRERQLASSISAYDYTPTELGVFVVHLEAPAATTADALRAAWAEVRALREGGVQEHELVRARKLNESGWVRRFESMEGQANYLAEWEAAGGWALGERYLVRLLTATAAEVSEAVRRYLDPDAAAVVVYRPAGGPTIAADADAARALLDGAPAAAAPVAAPRAEPNEPTGAIPHFEREEAGVRVYRTVRGVPILVRRKPGAVIANLGVYARGGVVDESDADGGLTMLMARTALKGTRRRSAAQIAEDGELLGGSVGASVGSESFGWSISVPAANLRAATELLADVALAPAFEDESLERERTVLLSELSALRDDMFRYPVRLLNETAYAGHPYARSTLGSETSVRAATPDALARWHADRFMRGPQVIAAVCDTDPDAVAAVLASCFDALEPAPTRLIAAPAWPDATVERAEQRAKMQTAIALGFPGPGRRDDDRHAASLIASVASGLGGRFFDELRDRQSLAYTVHAYAVERAVSGAFIAYIATSPEKEAIARRGLLAEFARLRDEPVTADELERAQTYAIGTHAIRQESGGAVLGDVVDAWLFGAGLRELAEHDDAVRAVTADRMREVARRYFDESRVVTGVVRGGG